MADLAQSAIKEFESKVIIDAEVVYKKRIELALDMIIGLEQKGEACDFLLQLRDN